jgi:TolB-like protein/Flp pilus assembly protein TadD
MRTFVQELKHRRVYRVALAYLVAGSAMVQLAGTVLPTFHAPEWVLQLFVFLVAICFPVALGLGWTFDLRRGGIQRTPSRPGYTADASKQRFWIVLVIGSFVAASGLAGYWFWHPWTTESNREPGRMVVTGKSIAVLPFDNLSDDKDAEYFTEGVQDEILTNLARVADLKVISRTSVRQYKSGTTRNLRAIASELGVAHVVEGSVQRSKGRVRISAQLIDARTDMHVWAERYDRELADIFAIQTEVAEKIVSQLKVRLSPGEKAAIEERPTHDLAAYNLYLRARNLIEATAFNSRAREDLFEATRLLDEAVARDPTFLLAYYRLASAHDQIYFFGIDHTPARLAAAEAAVQMTLRLRPDSGEAHLARAQHLYWGYRDYDHAREELTIAQILLPNEPLALVLAGYIDRRQGRWELSIQEMQRAMELDPRNLFILQQISFSYGNLRRFKDVAATLDRILLIAPKDVNTRVQRACVDLDWRADPKPLRATVKSILAENPKAMATLIGQWMYLAMCERDAAAAQQVLDAIGPEGTEELGFQYPKAWYEGTVARAHGDNDRARAAFTLARIEVEKTVREQPAYAQPLSLLGMIDAGLGRKEEAIREGERAIELLPVSKDALSGPGMVENLALIYAWTGENERACEQLAVITSIPYDLSYGKLRSHPFWDPIRGNPCFEKIVASLAPKE